MNFALLGDDPDVLPLVRAISRSHQHRIDVAALIGDRQADLSQSAPGLRVLPGWDRMVSGEVDAVIVCGVEEPALEAAKQLAAAGKPLVIFPRSGQGSTWIYELALIRDEGKTRLVPVFVDRLRPSVRTLRETIASGGLGRILYLQIDREILSFDGEGGSPLLAKDPLEDALLHDVDLLRSLGGDYSRVSAVQSGIMGDRVAAAAATLLGDQLPEATWTARGTSLEARWKLTVAGERGQFQLTAAGNPVQWRLDGPLPDAASSSHVNPGGQARAAADTFDEGELILQSIAGESALPAAANWTDLVRSFEVVDGARTSARRRRAIDLHLETASERNIFKSQMTAVGCLLLTFSLVGVVLLLLVMPLFDARSRAQIEADRAGAIIRSSDFAPATPVLNAKGSSHLRQLAPRLDGTRFPILIAENKGAEGRRLSERRRDAVAAELTKLGAKNAADRTQIGPVVGEWYPQMLRVVRILVFAPLALFLALQALVLLTRPAAK